MNVYLAKNFGDQLPGDLILRWVLRSDLAPVPRTVEMVVRDKDELKTKLRVGATFWTGHESLEYEVVKTRGVPGGMIQGREETGALMVTALLASCARVAYRRSQAVIRENARLGELYRACGATATIANDFPVRWFVCLRGQVPSFFLAQAMQEESAALVFRNGQLSVSRLSDLMKQAPKDEIGQTDPSEVVDSEFLERHEIPSFFSLTDDGEFRYGDVSATRAIHYLPRADERMLRNAGKVLVTRRVLPAEMAQQINAGDVLRVGGASLVVITAAHTMERGENEGGLVTASRFWLGGISE